MEKHCGYIAERILSNRREELCCCCTLDIDGLDPCMKPPFTLRHIEAACIRPICGNICFAEAHGCNRKQTERIQLCLMCWVGDACGHVSCGHAQIEIDAQAVSCPGNIHRGAEIAIAQARFCGMASFWVELRIDLYTVLSRTELIQPAKCECEHQRLPLFPPACQPACLPMPKAHTHGAKRRYEAAVFRQEQDKG